MAHVRVIEWLEIGLVQETAADCNYTFSQIVNNLFTLGLTLYQSLSL